MSKERYRKNRERVFEIYGLDIHDRRYNTHHIIFKSDTKREPFKGYDVDQKANLCPMLKSRHMRLHRFVEMLSPRQVRKFKKRKRK